MTKTLTISVLAALLLTNAPAFAEVTQPPAKTTPAPTPTSAVEPITLSPDEVAGVITLLGQMPAAQSSQLYNFFIAKEQAAQAARAKK